MQRRTNDDSISHRLSLFCNIFLIGNLQNIKHSVATNKKMLKLCENNLDKVEIYDTFNVSLSLFIFFAKLVDN